MWNNRADELGVGRPDPAAPVRDMGEQVADQVYARSKASYKLIDDATEGRFQPNADKIQNINMKLRDMTGTDDVTEAKLLDQKRTLLAQQDQIFADAEAAGVPKTTVNAAKQDYKTAQAIYDTNHEIQMSTSGVRPGMKGSAKVPEEVNGKSLMNRFNKIYNAGRLQEALGEKGSEALIGHAADALKGASNVVRNRWIASTLGPTVLVSAYEALK